LLIPNVVRVLGNSVIYTFPIETASTSVDERTCHVTEILHWVHVILKRWI
jgi:hypothetical protein